MEELQTYFPEGLEYTIPYDTTIFVEQSIREVFVTLFQAAGLVFLVLFIFLQDWRATVVPAVTIPVSLIGTLAVMLAMGFSLNMLTLFGLVLAIGIVVDDAIVVVEATATHIEQGLKAKEAAIKAMNEVSGPVVATTLVLLAVFVPSAFCRASPADVSSVRPDHRHLHHFQFHQRPDPQSGPGGPSTASAEGAQKRVLPRI